MRIRWRLGVLALQLGLLLWATQMATGRPWSDSVWFFSGLLAVSLNRQLLEPYFARPVDTIANSIVGLLLIAVAEKNLAYPGWWAAGIVLGAACALALTAQLFGQAGGRLERVSRAARRLTVPASSVPIYSLIFFLDLIESFPLGSDTFWLLAITWAAIALVGSVDWEAAWFVTRGDAPSVEVVGFVGPSRIAVVRASLPSVGTSILLRNGQEAAEGVLVRRVRRSRAVYGEIFIPQESSPERFLSERIVMETGESEDEIVGVVDQGSTDRLLRFSATRELAVGDAVFVQEGGGELIFQISAVELRRKDERDGAVLEAACTALQLGRWSAARSHIERYAWVAPAGSAVTARSYTVHDARVPDGSAHLGDIIGSHIPVFLDLQEASSGHLLVLGMTKMGKSTLAIRLARALAETRPVVILDQTGEYRTRHAVPTCTAESLMKAGLSLKEPQKGEVGPVVAKAFFEKLLDQMATDEYEEAEIRGRTILVEEAHQFIPEPAGLGFKAPGRDEAYELGTMMMQIRKYGLSVVLISQRTAVVGKSAISQCENIIAFRSVDRTGLDYLEGIMGRESVELLPRLRQGQAIVAGPAFNADEPVAVQMRLD
jgi:hypothetical protein